jgi:hypothetical protein
MPNAKDTHTWIDPKTGLWCEVVLNTFGLPPEQADLDREWWCGYVHVPKGCPNLGDGNIDVHGGVTYQDDDVIGFDTIHAGDEDRGWTKEKVMAETTRLAAQIARIAGPLVLLTDGMTREND